MEIHNKVLYKIGLFFRWLATIGRKDLCPECGKYPADDNGVCLGCGAHREHTEVW